MRDDGRGIDPEVLEAAATAIGASPGMRERAQRIGGSSENSQPRGGRHGSGAQNARPGGLRAAGLRLAVGCQIVQEIPGGVFDGRNGESVMNSKRKIRVFSVDDHPLLREGIAAIINNQDDMVMVAQAVDRPRGDSALSRASARRDAHGPSDA